MTTQPAVGVVPEWTWGDRVRKVRRIAKLGQAEFGATLGVSPATVASWEASINEPRNAVTLAKRIEVAFGWSPAWMLGLTTEHPSPPHGRGEPGSGDLPGVIGTESSITTGQYTYSAA